jgi:lysophospholipase L1-like esterase
MKLRGSYYQSTRTYNPNQDILDHDINSDERIAARNALAAEIVGAQKIPTVDLNAAVRGHPELQSDNVHFNGQGVQILAAQVCAAVEKLLPR